MNKDHSSKSQAHPEREKEQFPVDTAVLTNVRLYVDSALGDLVRIVVMNNLSTSQCDSYAEYYHGNAGLSVESVDSLTLRGDTIEGTQQNIDDFVSSMPLHLKIRQPCNWYRGVYTPSGARKRLYKATDPDDSTRMIGLLIEQDSQGKIAQITWYKTTNGGAVFRSTPRSLRFALVKDQKDAISLDPNDIGGWTWYYTTSFGSCS